MRLRASVDTAAVQKHYGTTDVDSGRTATFIELVVASDGVSINLFDGVRPLTGDRSARRFYCDYWAPTLDEAKSFVAKHYLVPLESWELIDL